MCTASIMENMPGQPAGKSQSEKPRAIRSAADVPLGTGLADGAKEAILTRREQLDAAIDGVEVRKEPIRKLGDRFK